jgi:hypothetical protein
MDRGRVRARASHSRLSISKQRHCLSPTLALMADNVPDFVALIHPADGPSLGTREQALLARARRELAELLPDERSPDCGLPFKPCAGWCRVCAKYTRLTFEHLPPKASGNRNRRRFVGMLDALNTADPLTLPKHGWRQLQQGIGAYVLCAECNSRAGSLYVNEYVSWVASAVAFLAERFAVLPPDGALPESVSFRVHGRPGRIIRQAISMILAVSGGPFMARAYPELAVLAQGGNAHLPANVRLYLSLAVGSRGRLSTPTGAVDFRTGTCRVLTEVAFSPFAWLLCIGDQPTESLCDVTAWTDFGLDEMADVAVHDARLGSTASALPGDYRWSDEIPI